MDEPFTGSEPTTGEINDWISTQIIVRMLRKIQNSAQVVLDSGFGTRDGECNMVYRDRRDNMKLAADRLESQECEIEELKSEAIVNALENAERIANLTARAEQAEAREKAAIERMRDRCEFCTGYELEENDDPCRTCYNARTFEPDDIPRTKKWTYRGLPQDGEGL